MIGERPYSSGIHPVVSSAMSYDPSKSSPTPSSIGLARDVYTNTKDNASEDSRVTYAEAEAWTMNSWAYLNTATLVVNCTVLRRFSSSESLNELVPFQKWLRCILDCSIACLDSKVDVICMGVPSTNVVDSTLRSMGSSKRYVTKRVYPNPAMSFRMKRGDVPSHDLTFNRPGTSQAIAKAIIRSRKAQPLKPLDFLQPISSTMASHTREVEKLTQASASLVDELESAFNDLKTTDKIPSLRKAHDDFVMAMLSYRDMVIRDVLEYTVTQRSAQNSSKLGKPVEWGGKSKWNRGTPSVGTSSKMSIVSSSEGGVAQKFADDDDAGQDTETGSAVASPAASSNALLSPEGTRKKKVVRRVKKRVSAPQKATVPGNTLNEQETGVLRTVLYYVMDNYGENSLSEDIDTSVSTLKVKSENVALILGCINEDSTNNKISVERSLGMEDGNVVEDSLVFKLITKLCQPLE